MVMLFPRRGNDKLWRLIHYTTGRAKRNDENEELTYVTKVEAEKARREFESSNEFTPSAKGDYYPKGRGPTRRSATGGNA